MCTSIQMRAQDKSLLFARTMDWHHFTAAPLYLPTDYKWHSVYNGQGIQNSYAILGVGRASSEWHADISDGVNTAGLAVQKLTFSNHSDYQNETISQKTALAPFEFVLWALGNCSSVADLTNRIEEVQLMSDKFSQLKYGRNDLHFAATDPTGQMISIEPQNGTLKIIPNRIGVVTNAPDFEKEIPKLAPYMDLTASSNQLNRISTGNFSGKLVFPGGFTPTSRFIRATILKERAIIPKNQQENVSETWHILNAVTVPKSDGRSDTYTVYRSAVEVKSRTLYFEAYHDLGIRSYQFLD